MKTATLKKDNELKKELWKQGHSFRAVSGFCCPALHLSIQFKCFGWLLNRLWWTTLSAKDLCLVMHLELKPAETENFMKEKAFVSLFKTSLNRKLSPPQYPHQLLLLIFHLAIIFLQANLLGSVYFLPLLIQDTGYGVALISRLIAPRGWNLDLRTANKTLHFMCWC